MHNIKTGNGADHDMFFEPAPELGNMPKKADVIDYSYMITIITAWSGILNARLLALLSLMGALVMFGFAMYDPTTLRLIGVSLYSIGVLWPVIALFLRKG